MKKIVIITSFFAFAASAMAQQSILMKITPAGSEKTSYIFATNENKNIPAYRIENKLNEIIQQVDAVTFDWLQDAAQRQKMFEIMQFNGEDDLKKLYKREDNIRYELMVMDKLKSDVQKYVHTQPLYTMQLFREKDFGSGTGYQNGVIFQLALNASKPVLSIINARQMEDIINTMNFDMQAGVLSNYVNNAAKFLQTDDENLIRYLNGELDAVATSVANIQQPDYLRLIQSKITDALVSRMAATIPAQSTLFVINAELLGGSNGIIQKMEDAGFTVESVYFLLQKSNDTSGTGNYEAFADDHFPVLQTSPLTQQNANPKIIYDGEQTPVSKQFIAAYDPFNDLLDASNADTAFLKTWNKVSASDANCFIAMPIKAEWENIETPTMEGTIKSGSYSGNHARSDLYYSIGYSIYPPAFYPGSKAEFFNDFVRRAAQKLKGEVIAQRIISTPDYTGREFTIVVSDSFFVRSKIILRDNITYQLLCGGPGDKAYSVYANAFFNSFRLESKLANNWYYYENPLFTCNLPTPPLISSQTINTKYGPLLVQSFAAEDYKEEISYLVSTYTYPDDYDFGNKNAFFASLITNAEQQYIGKTIKTGKAKKNGLEGRYAELQLTTNKIYKVYFFIEGHSVYQYLAGGTPLAMQSVNPDYFFNTFNFIIEEK